MHPIPPTTPLFIGLMSGTSLDGVDGVLAAFPGEGGQTLGAAYVPFPEILRAELMALQSAGANEIHREALAANALQEYYAKCVAQLLAQTALPADMVCAIGVHGQTIRHRPELGYTRQINNPALLAELTGIDVIADFRSRDIAAGGQGAPLVPAFHQAAFSAEGQTRVVANIGGISNISVLACGADQRVVGFDTGPGNVLMDAWTAQHLGTAYDENGAWAAKGTIIPALLEALLDEDFFDLAPPKSTGRDLFNPDWLAGKLSRFHDWAPADVQASLAALTASTLAQAIARHAPGVEGVFICGGGAYNTHLMRLLQQALADLKQTATVQSSTELGIEPSQVEALAFAWLAHRFTARQPGNLPLVTGANGLRILGALYPA